jgi:hypothetical protein
MGPLDFIDKLAARARGEPAPLLDVRDRVLARIREREEIPLTPLFGYVAWLAPTAAAVMFFAVRAWGSLSGWLVSLNMLSDGPSPLSVVMP